MQFGLLGDGLILLLLLLSGGMGLGIGRLDGAGEGTVDIVVRDEVEVEETLAIGGRHGCDAEEQPNEQQKQASRKAKQSKAELVRRRGERKGMKLGPASGGRDGWMTHVNMQRSHVPLDQQCGGVLSFYHKPQ